MAKLVNSPTQSYIPGSCAENEDREEMASSSAHNIDMCDNDETDVYKRNMYNFIVANKEDSGHLVLEERRQYMVRKYIFLELMFEHTTGNNL